MQISSADVTKRVLMHSTKHFPISKKSFPVISARPSSKLVKAPIGTMQPKEKPLPPLDVLKTKYKTFSNQYEMLDAALQAITCLRHILNCKEILGAANGVAPNETANNWTKWESNDLRLQVADPTSAHFRYIKITPEYIETIIDIAPFNLVLGFSNDDFAENMRRRGNNIIRSYFPSFKPPTDWVNTKEDYTGRNRVRVDAPDIEVLYSLEKFATIKPNYTTSTNESIAKQKWAGPQYFKLPTGYAAKKFSGICNLRLTLEMNEGTINNANRARESRMEEGTLESLGRNTTLHVPISPQIVMRWPIEYALYATSSPSKKDFIPFLFYQFTAWHRASYASKRLKRSFSITPPERVNHLGVVKEMIAQEQAEGRKVKSRTNADDFLIIGAAEPSESGQVTWIQPKLDNVDEYLSIIKNSYNPTDAMIDTKDFNVMAGKPLFTDWYNEKFTFVRESGLGAAGDSSDASGIQTLDLVGSIPLDSTTIDRDLSELIRLSDSDLVKSFITVIEKFMAGDVYPFKPSTAFFDRDVLAKNDILYRYSSYINSATKAWLFLIGGNEKVASDDSVPVTWGNLGGVPFVDADKDSFKAEKEICKIFRTICEELLENFDSIRISYHSKISWLRYRLWLIVHYSGNWQTYANEALTKLNQNMGKGINPKEPSTVRMPNLPGVENFMPHQIETANLLDADAETVLLDTSVGGGKTISGLREALAKIEQNKVKRAIFVVPGNLIRGWTDSVMQFSKGQVNPFVITLNGVRRLQAIEKRPDGLSDRPNYKLLKKVIESCPPNTIFITNYGFLRCDNEDIVYGNVDITRLHAAEFLRDIGFEFVGLDESHFTKNLGSKQTMGASIVVSAAKYKRAMSGTLVSNNLTDLVGQVAMANPATFGTAQHFNKKYGDGNGNAVIAWQKGAEKMISEDARPYLMRITKKNQEWAFLLPRVEEAFHSVRMTPKQTEFYEAMVQDALDDMKENDPKLVSKMQDANENDEAAIMQGLSRYFAKVEEFLYAPDSNAAFMALDGVTTVDATSPKMPKIIEILDQHFNGFVDSDTREKVAPSAYKVLIFAARTQVSIHVMKHLPKKYQAMAAHYQAGNHSELEKFITQPDIKILVADEGCFPAHMHVLIDYDKSLPIEDVYNDKSITHVLSYDLDNKKIIRRKITDRFKYEFKEDKDVWYDVTVFDKERGKQESFRVTGNHMVFMKDHSEKRVDALKAGDELITYAGDFVPHTKSKYTGEILPRSEYESMSPQIESSINIHNVDVISVCKAGVNSHAADKLKFDLEVEGHHNYFVVAGSAPYTSKTPSIPILVHNSINMGQNLQMASRLIRLQALWSPGDQTQAFGRIWRPDFKDLHGRPVVYQDWIFTDMSLESPKIARLISKMIQNKKYDRSEDPEFTRIPYRPNPTAMAAIKQMGQIPLLESDVPIDMMLNTLPLIKMTWDNLEEFKSVKSVYPYFAYYRLMNQWEDDLFVKQKSRGDQKLVPIDPAQRVTIKGSSKIIYIPRVAGIDPKNFDPKNLYGYKPISVIQTENELANIGGDDSEGEENLKQINTVEEGDMVDTEFGIGFIVKELDKDVRVDIPGLPDTVKLSKACVWLITNEEMQVKLRRQLKAAGKAGLLRLPPALLGKSLKQAFTPIETDEPEKEVPSIKSPTGGGAGGKPIVKPSTRTLYDTQEDEEETGTHEIELFAEIIDGEIGLTCFAEDEESEFLEERFKFRMIDNYYAIKVVTSQGLAELLEFLDEEFTVTPELLNNFKPYVGLMRSKKLGVFEPALFANTLRFFNIDSHKKVTGDVVRPFPIVWGGQLYVAFNKNRTQAAPKVLAKVRGAAITGIRMLKQPLQENLHLALFRTKQDAINCLYKIEKSGVSIPNMEETLQFLRQLRSTVPTKTSVSKLPAAKIKTQVQVVRNEKKPVPPRIAERKPQPPVKAIKRAVLPPVRRK